MYVHIQGIKSVQKEIDDLNHSGPYRAPKRLRKRSDFSSKAAENENKVFEANEYVLPVSHPHSVSVEL
jgi:hypothetical protein